MATQTPARQSSSRGTQPFSVMPLSEAVNQLFRDAFTSPWSGNAGMTNNLGVNMYERDDSYILQVPLPGVKPDQLNITARENRVTLQGTAEFTAPEGARPLFQGVSGGQFREQLALPGDVDAERAQAQFQDGVLILTLPKAPHAQERRIAISQGSNRSA